MTLQSTSDTLICCILLQLYMCYIVTNCMPTYLLLLLSWIPVFNFGYSGVGGERESQVASYLPLLIFWNPDQWIWPDYVPIILYLHIRSHFHFSFPSSVSGIRFPQSLQRMGKLVHSSSWSTFWLRMSTTQIIGKPVTMKSKLLCMKPPKNWMTEGCSNELRIWTWSDMKEYS